MLGHADAEVQRLLLQGRIYNDHTEHALRVAGLRPGMRVHGTIKTGDQRGHQVIQRIIGRHRKWVKRRPVPAGARALSHHRVNPAAQCDCCFIDRGHRGKSQNVGTSESTTLTLGRRTEGEGHNLRPQIAHHIKLRGPVIVIMARFTKSDAVVSGLQRQRRRERMNCSAVPLRG